MDELQRFKETYITECFELLDDMEEKLLALDEDSPDLEDLNAIFRCAHSIKGGSGAFGFNQITKFTHILEELLDSMRNGDVSPTRENIDALLLAADVVKKMVSAAQSGESLPDDFGSDLAKKLIEFSDRNIQEAPKKEAEEEDPEEISIYDINFEPFENIFQTGNEPLLIIRELKTLGEVTLTSSTDKIPDFSTIKPENCYLNWNITLETDKTINKVKEVFEFVEDECKLTIEKIAGFTKPSAEKPVVKEKAPVDIKPAPKTTPKEAAKKPDDDNQDSKTPAVTSIRVDINKIDRLVNQVGELVITQAMIAAQSNKLRLDEYPDLIQGINILHQHTVELQEAVMSVRMQPVKSVFSRMPRIVRDLCTQLGKDIRLEMYGENTELDKTVIEQLADPLMHMIRNSVDHGIDSPESRKARGKKEQGVIKLSAEHAGGKIVIKIQDDGLGINREKVLSKAKEKGLVTQEATPSDSEIDNLIFLPGFSTAETVSNISGRGVGMDVVKKNVEAAGGTVNLVSIPQEGTTFIVTLPLTLAILDGMIVRVGKEKYIIPIGNIIETLRPKKDDVRKIADANDLINVRGEFISIIYLHRFFDIPNAEIDASKALVVLVENGLDKFGLVVDELIGQQQVVIKSLEENTDAVPGISAATILGDGKVSLILDITKLQELAIKNAKAPQLAQIA